MGLLISRGRIDGRLRLTCNQDEFTHTPVRIRLSAHTRSLNYVKKGSTRSVVVGIWLDHLILEISAFFNIFNEQGPSVVLFSEVKGCLHREQNSTSYNI